MAVCQVEFRIAKQYGSISCKRSGACRVSAGAPAAHTVHGKIFSMKALCDESEGERRGTARGWFSGQRGKRNDSRKGAPPQANGPIRTRRTFCLPFHLHRFVPRPPLPLPPRQRHRQQPRAHPLSRPAFTSNVYFSPLRSREGGFPCFPSPPFAARARARVCVRVCVSSCSP